MHARAFVGPNLPAPCASPLLSLSPDDAMVLRLVLLLLLLAHARDAVRLLLLRLLLSRLLCSGCRHCCCFGGC